MDSSFNIAFTRKVLLASAWGLVILVPASLKAEGVSLLADLQYFHTERSSTEKATGITTDGETSRFSQLYQLDLSRSVYQNLSINLGGYFEDDTLDSTITSAGEPELSSSITQTALRPYAEIRLANPLYNAGLAYRTRDAKTKLSGGLTESRMVKDYLASINWRPVYLPLFNFYFQRIELQEEPLTFDSRRDTVNLISKYNYKNINFEYTLFSQKNIDNLKESGTHLTNHNGRVAFNRRLEYNSHRFDVNASAKINYSTTEFINAGDSIDNPASRSGLPFYIANDSPPTSNEPFDLALVGGSNRLISINIGRGGGLNPVSAGLGFESAVEIQTIYIRLSEDTTNFPNLASSSQVAAIADSFDWQFYSSDDEVELNWTEQPISSADYNSIDNRFEIRLASPVSARRVKVTTVPKTLSAPGEIRYADIRALTTVSGAAGQTFENIDQKYNFGVQWTPGTRTRVGYNVYYQSDESKPVSSSRTTWVNNLFFNHALSDIFTTYGRLSRNDTNRRDEGEDEDQTSMSYSLGLKGIYLETLSQSLIFTGTDSSFPEGTSTTKSIILRTSADLYTGWSVNLDLAYGTDSFLSGEEQTVKTIRLSTNLEPNRRLDINLDYAINWVEDAEAENRYRQSGAFRVLWQISDALNMFFKFNFRDEQETDEILFNRELNLNWAPFPDGALQFNIGLNEEKDFSQRQARSINPSLTWNIARGAYLELQYSVGVFETLQETTDFNNISARLKIFY